MKTILQLIVMLFFVTITLFQTTAKAQFIPNSGFEDTVTINGTLQPVGWTLSESFGAGSSTMAASGNYSLSVWNWYYYAEAFAFNGSYSNVYEPHKGGTPFNQKASKLTGMYYYDTTNTSSIDDSAVVAVLLKKYNSTTNQIDTVAFGEAHLPSTNSESGFIPFEVIINDWQPGINPDSIVVFIKSAKDGFCAMSTSGTCLYLNVDDLALQLFMGVVDFSSQGDLFDVFPNPSHSLITVSNHLKENASYRLLSLDGRLMNQLTIMASESVQIDLSQFSKGMYVLQMETNQGFIQSKKIILSE